MSRRTHVSLDDRDVEGRFASWLKMTIDLIAPKDLYLIAGRATAKTTDIIAERSQMIIRDMPRSMQVLVSDTYMNAMRNIVPSLLEGWERKGWKRGIHYVTDQKPPPYFKLPFKPVETYKHTISIYNGVLFNLGSLDQPTGLAGGSYQHIYGDEARVLKFDKLKKLTPAIRGEYVHFGHSVFYRGRTFTTDMPNILEGDDDWILQQEKNFNVEQVKLALQVALVLNEIKKEVLAAKQIKDYHKIGNLKKNLVRWTERWVRVRKNLTFFYIASSFVNADILTEGYFQDSLKALGIEEFKSAILSLRINLKKGEKFYSHLGEHHYFDDGIRTGFYDHIKLTEANEIEETSLALKYLDCEQKLECGVDFGDMTSMVIGQPRGNYYYLLKEFYTLPPESSKELADKFRSFFKHQKVKILDMYYDRSGNQYQQINRDWAAEIAGFIEFENGIATGWKVNLMNRNQATILQSEEYKLVNNILGEQFPELPKLKIDQFQCKCLKSSLELTKIIVKTDRKNSKTIHKDKRSEKLPMLLRPMFSTNFSDAFKYLVCRAAYMKITKAITPFDTMEPSTH
ncbi:hypothetical protein [Flavobacterium sp. NKUCC04_CG]|uniref:hypothetical protein n=1 Tax=Flavobacterium sp. NKUCC04_CG TaxID=2842121 RepID=UPI001C5AA3F7|nr:hypothetical protein [Flavobacterium sp. NKUCC04_CG]MBW3519505.1 hypothetical protein [Flavobacterium sp. NKUCC04_CG]